MALPLNELIAKAQTRDWGTEVGNQAFEQLISRILRTQRFYRRSPKWDESAVVREINQQLRSHLLPTLLTTIQHIDPQGLSAQEWVQAQRRKVYHAVLDNRNLTRLACVAQQYREDSPLRREALNDLIEAIYLSQRLSKKQAFSPIYEEAVSRTLSHVYEKIDQYRPHDAPVMAWVNYWLGIALQEAEQSRKDPLIRQAQEKQLRTKAKFKRWIKSISVETLERWLTLTLGSSPAKSALPPMVLGVLVICWWLAQQMVRSPHQADNILYTLVDQRLNLPTQMDALDNNSFLMPQNQPPLLSEKIRQSIAEDSQGRCQAHLRGRPEVTFQIIALAYLDGTPWQTLADQFGLSLSTLSSFYQRQLEKLAPYIRADIVESSFL